jgi:hypothetical protein
MRSSLWSIGPAALLAFLALMPVSGVFAEDGEVEDNVSDGSQIVPEGAAPFVPSANSLNTVPEDGAMSRSVQMQDSPWVQRILAARPNEDLVICIAGCYSGRDRVVYAQPISTPAKTAETKTSGGTPKRAASAEPRDPKFVSRTN